jgi:hypothetical protein
MGGALPARARPSVSTWKIKGTAENEIIDR